VRSTQYFATSQHTIVSQHFDRTMASTLPVIPGLCQWKDCSAVYPSFEEITTAIQDLGKHQVVKVKGREQRQHRYPLVEKLASKVYSSILLEFNNPEGLTKNVHRGKMTLVREIIIRRRHTDISETDSLFHPYGIEGKVYIITNNTVHAGLDVCIKSFQEAIEASIRQKNTARTSNDGLRLGCILLDGKYRGSVAGIMTRKKSRQKSDIPGDSTTHFFELIVKEAFSNVSYQVSPPSECYYTEFPEEEKGSWDPNDAAIFEHERTGIWLKATWDEYLKPKYKKALDKWNKDTGGGDGTPSSFIDYCGGDRWLVYLFCKDIDSNFLLASSAGGRMPRHLQIESGFNEEVSCITDYPPSSAGKRAAIEDEISEVKKQRARIDNTLDRVCSFVESRNVEEDVVDGYISKVADYSQKMQDSTTLETMSPDSKEMYVESLKKQRKHLLRKIQKDIDKN
jgi:hypothetical protein